MKYKTKKLWFFGDSFCASKKNWVTYVKNHYDYKTISHLGQEGTPPLVPIRHLLNNIDNISENDGVVFCISEPSRPSFKGKTLPVLGYEFKNKRQDMKDFNLTEKEWLSLKLFMENLFTWEDWNILGHSSIFFLLEKLLKNLPTKKVVYLFSFYETMSPVVHGDNYRIIPKKYLKYPSLYNLFYDYGMRIYNSKDIVMEIMSKSRNHWIEDGDFWNESFFPTYKPILDKLK